MEWSDDLGGLRLRMRREPNSPQNIVLEFDVRDRALLKNKPILKIIAVTQRQKDRCRARAEYAVASMRSGQWTPSAPTDRARVRSEETRSVIFVARVVALNAAAIS